MVPGETLTKDPTVTVYAVSEACWLFVKVEEVNNVDTFLTYAIADGWTELTGVDGVDNVYYRAVNDTDANQTFAVLANNQVTVNKDVDMDDMDGLSSTNYPQLKFTAYAIQSANILDNDSDGSAVDEAWAQLNTSAS